jgi:hypothetical protein
MGQAAPDDKTKRRNKDKSDGRRDSPALRYQWSARVDSPWKYRRASEPCCCKKVYVEQNIFCGFQKVSRWIIRRLS